MFPFLCDTLFFDLGVPDLPSCFWKFFYIAWHRATGHPFFFYSVVLSQKCVTKGKSPLSCSLIEDSCTRLYSTCTNAAKAHTNPTKWLWSDEGTKIKCISHQAVMLLKHFSAEKLCPLQSCSTWITINSKAARFNTKSNPFTRKQKHACAVICAFYLPWSSQPRSSRAQCIRWNL